MIPQGTSIAIVWIIFHLFIAVNLDLVGTNILYKVLYHTYLLAFFINILMFCLTNLQIYINNDLHKVVSLHNDRTDILKRKNIQNQHRK